MLSIVVPVYNEEKYIEELLLEVIEQISPEDELIVIDDGSSDDSANIVKNIFDKSNKSNCKYYFKENGGLGSACNLGMDKSTKEYIQFVDSDDIIEKDFVRKIKDNIKKYSPDILVYNIKNVKLNNEVSVMKNNLPTNKMLTIDSASVLNIAPSAKNKTFKKSLFYENEIFFPKHLWFEDLCTVTKLISMAESIVNVDDINYIYMHRMDSIITSSNIEKNLDIFIVIDEIIDFFEEKGLIVNHLIELKNIVEEHLLLYTVIRILKNGQLSKTKYLLNEIVDKYQEVSESHFNNIKLIDNEIFTKKEKIIIFLIKNRRFEILRFLVKGKK